MTHKLNRKASGFTLDRIINEELPHWTEADVNIRIQGLYDSWEYQRVGNTLYNIPLETWNELMATIKAKFPNAKTLEWYGSKAEETFRLYPSMRL